ncbi:MAG: hypothetical protein ACYTG5_07215 [Planctomycetota bacterium]|jgi:hypothetical protein
MSHLRMGSLSIVLLAQLGTAQRDLAAGFSAQSLEIDLDAVTGEFGSLGVQHLDGEIFTTTRIDPEIGGLHFVTVFDGSGTKLRSWPQPAFAQASEWGFRDGASDGANLFFGFEFGIEIVDVNGVLLDGLAGPNLQAANGPQTHFTGLISGNVLKPEQAGVTRALAYDRYGNGGDGSFWTGNFGSSTFEIDTAGDVLRSYPNAGEISYGFGIDPVSRRDSSGNIDPTAAPTRMWVNSAPLPGEFWGSLGEYDLTTGTLTGQIMRPIRGIQGGLDIVPASLGRGTSASGYDILHLQQGDPDKVRIRRLHLDVAGEGTPPSPKTRLGTLEPDLLISLHDEEYVSRSDHGMLVYSNLWCRRGPAPLAFNLFLDISRNPGDGLGHGGLNGIPAIIFANIGPDAAVGVDATSNALNIRELAHLQPLLTMPQPQFAVRSRGMVLTNDPLSPSPSEWRIPLVANDPFQAISECVRFQGLWIDQSLPFLPLALTNQARFCRGSDPAILCGAQAICFGTNSSNANPSSGFFHIFNERSDPDAAIVELEFSIRPGDATNSAATRNLFDTLFRFDTDQGGMADTFEGGNSQFFGCQGTYRNGTDVTTGLIYAGTPQQNLTPCDQSSLQGWVGSDDGPTHYGSDNGDYLTLKFRFSPDTFLNGAKFEFDCDTDGGVGVSGDAMAGLMITVTYQDGLVSSAEFQARAGAPNFSFARL